MSRSVPGILPESATIDHPRDHPVGAMTLTAVPPSVPARGEGTRGTQPALGRRSQRPLVSGPKGALPSAWFLDRANRPSRSGWPIRDRERTPP
jgi:hypothetical protein